MDQQMKNFTRVRYLTIQGHFGPGLGFNTNERSARETINKQIVYKLWKQSSWQLVSRTINSSPLTMFCVSKFAFSQLALIHSVLLALV
jgi:hypothetical protein